MLEKSPAGCLGRAAVVLPGGFLVAISPKVRVECAGLELVVGGRMSGISPRLASPLRPGASFPGGMSACHAGSFPGGMGARPGAYFFPGGMSTLPELLGPAPWLVLSP
jgi:hypothetical protein